MTHLTWTPHECPIDHGTPRAGARLIAADTPLYYWGDIDAGGLRIAAHLEDTFGLQIRLHQMQPELAVALGSELKSRKGLDRLVGRAENIGELARRLETEKAKILEQEELDPESPLLAATARNP